jgi:hypothetical protein
VEVIDVAAHEPRRIPSKKWRELIKKVWEADPLRCPKCSREMRIVSLIDEEDVIERILRHLGLWQEGCACIPAPTRRAKRPSIRGSTTPSPTTTPNRSWRSPPPERRQRPSAPLAPVVHRPPALRRQLFRVVGAPRNPKKPVFDFRAHSCHSAPMETHAFGFRLPGNAPEGQKRFPISHF